MPYLEYIIPIFVLLGFILYLRHKRNAIAAIETYAPAIYAIVEILAMQNIIPKSEKAITYLRIFQELAKILNIKIDPNTINKAQKIAEILAKTTKK